jgi:hypothetical protein
MRQEGHVARIGDIRYAYKLLVGKPEGKKHLRDLGVDGRIIRSWILNMVRGCILNSHGSE